MTSSNWPAVSSDWISAIRRTIEGCLANPSADCVERIRLALTDFATAPNCPVAADFYDPADMGNYRRYLLHGSEGSAYSCLLIKWPPDHVTPLHDHGGVWGIELVIDGALQVEEYNAEAVNDEQTSLAPQRTTILGVCDSTAFVEPGYVHRCRNLSSRRPSLSLHVYGGMLAHFSTFHPVAEGRFAPARQVAAIDAVAAMPAI